MKLLHSFIRPEMSTYVVHFTGNIKLSTLQTLESSHITLTFILYFTVELYFAPDWFSIQVICLAFNGQWMRAGARIFCRLSQSVVVLLGTRIWIYLQLFSDQTQLEALREEYSKLERDYVTSRQKSKQKITDYVSDKAGVKFTELQNQLKKLRSDISLKHPVSYWHSGCSLKSVCLGLLTKLGNFWPEQSQRNMFVGFGNTA